MAPTEEGMAARRNKALQLKVELLDIRPPIWRRIEIPATYTFWDLHVAIQDAMGLDGLPSP